MFIKTLLAGAAIALAGTAVSAATVTTSFFLGEVTRTTNNQNTFDFTQFIAGERVKIEITLDDSVADTAAFINTGMFEDPTATVTLIGKTSGTTLTLSDGLKVRSRGSQSDLKIDSIETNASAANPFIIKNPLDFAYDLPTFSDPNDLGAVLADADLQKGRNGLTTFSFWDDVQGRELTGLQVTTVPLPATGLALIAALGVLGLRRRR